LSGTGPVTGLPTGGFSLDLEIFEGPFDLLVTLILNEDIDLLEVHLADIVLAYIDYPGLTLVNNLNLIAYSPAETVHAGNQPSGTLTMDTANNVEVIEVRRPKPGTWRIAVVGSNVARGPQDFALAYKADAQA